MSNTRNEEYGQEPLVRMKTPEEERAGIASEIAELWQQEREVRENAERQVDEIRRRRSELYGKWRSMK